MCSDKRKVPKILIENLLTKRIKTFVKSLFNLFKFPSKLVFKLTNLIILNAQIIIIKYMTIVTPIVGKSVKPFIYFK